MAAESASDPGRSPHLDERGRARMVDVSGKPATARTATARARIELSPTARAALLDGSLAKGEGMAVARLAAIQAAKETSRLIPLCHQVPLDGVEVSFEPVGNDGIEVSATARCHWTTGVEMEAMVAASVAALTLYDMCKGICRGGRVVAVELVHKAGGRSGEWRR